MFSVFRRRTYLVNKSSQLTYVSFSVIPAMVMTIFCVYFIFNNSDLILKDSREKPMVPIYNLQHSVASLETNSCSPELQAEVIIIKSELGVLTKSLESGYEETLSRWNALRQRLYLIMVMVLLFVGLWSFIYSHRIAGPLYRIRKNIDQMAKGEEIPPVILRKNDGFKDLAASLENLRQKIQENQNANTK